MSQEEKAAIEAASAERPRDLSDPNTQFRILNPETIGFTLDLPDGKRPIEIKLVFSLADIYKRRVFENIEACRTLIVTEIARFNRDGRPGIVDGAWIAANSQYIDVAMSLSHVRELARTVVASIATFADTGDGSSHAGESAYVSPDDLVVGMPGVQLSAITVQVIDIALKQVANQKNAAAAKRA